MVAEEEEEEEETKEGVSLAVLNDEVRRERMKVKSDLSKSGW